MIFVLLENCAKISYSCGCTGQYTATLVHTGVCLSVSLQMYLGAVGIKGDLGVSRQATYIYCE